MVYLMGQAEEVFPGLKVEEDRGNFQEHSLILFLQEFTQLEEGDHGDKTSHAASEVIAVMGHVSQSNI